MPRLPAAGHRDTGAAELTRSRLAGTIFLAGIVAFAGLYLASIGPYWNISPDSASYVGWGTSLAAGTGWGAPPVQPPMTAFVFAAVLGLFPTGYTALNALTPVLLFLSLGFAYVLLERRGGRNLALLAILLTLAAIPVQRASTQLLSEPVYMVFSLGALLLLDRAPGRRGGTDPGLESRLAPHRAWLAGVLLVATAMTRTVGLVLALAVLLVEGVAWVRRRRRPSLVLTMFALAALASIPLWQAYSDGSYASIWFRRFVRVDGWGADSQALSFLGLLDRVRDNVGLLPRSGGLLLNGWAREHAALDLFLQAAGTLAIASALWRALRLRAEVTEVYLGLYVALIAVHMLSGLDGSYRFLVPVAPLLFYYALDAARYAGRSLLRARPGPGMAVLLWSLAGFFLSGYLRIGWNRATQGVVEAHYSPFGNYPIKRPENLDGQRLAHWLRDNSRPEDRYAAAQRDMYDVLTERRGDDILPGSTHSRAAFVARLAQRGVRYLLVDRSGPVLGDSLVAVVHAYPERFRLLRALPGASLYEIRPKRPE